MENVNTQWFNLLFLLKLSIKLELHVSIKPSLQIQLLGDPVTQDKLNKLEKLKTTFKWRKYFLRVVFFLNFCHHCLRSLLKYYKSLNVFIGFSQHIRHTHLYTWPLLFKLLIKC